MLRGLKHLRDAVRASGDGSGYAQPAITGGRTADHADYSPFVLVEFRLDGLWQVYEEGSDAAGP